MGAPETKRARSSSRKRNFVAKKLREDEQFRKKIHDSKKDRDKQRKWRLSSDPTSDYESLDDMLMNGVPDA